MDENINISLLQADLKWENKQANLALFDRMIEQLPKQDGLQLILLPEMFTTGFSMDSARLAEDMDGRSVEWLLSKAKNEGAYIAGSLIVEENGRYYNRMLMAGPDGLIGHYDKRHLFRMGGEDKHYSMGLDRKIFRIGPWRICPQICYDLRFPVWSRNRDDYDLLIYLANWPAVRNAAWETLLQARAIENQAYVAGVNRVGPDGKGTAHCGSSMVIGPQGEVMAKSKSKEQDMVHARLGLGQRREYLETFPAYKDADGFLLK